MRRILLASILTLAATYGLTPSQAQAQWRGSYSGGNRFSVYVGGFGYGGYESYGYGGYGQYGQYGSYYGNGGHDYQPHWHETQTPYRPNVWYGNGPHDLAPHEHSHTPWSYQGYSDTAAGPTTSYYSPHPYYVAPW